MIELFICITKIDKYDFKSGKAWTLKIASTFRIPKLVEIGKPNLYAIFINWSSWFFNRGSFQNLYSFNELSNPKGLEISSILFLSQKKGTTNVAPFQNQLLIQFLKSQT